MAYFLFSSSSFPLSSSRFGGDCIKNLINKLFWALDGRFNSHVRGGCGTENVKNCSHLLELFIRHFVADAGDIFRFKNHVFCVAHMEDATDSIQNPFSPHKTLCSHGALYLNVSDNVSEVAQSIPVIEIFVLNKRILNKMHHTKMLKCLHF